MLELNKPKQTKHHSNHMKNQSHLHKNRGMTLIEITIALAIISILSVIALNHYGDSVSKTRAAQAHSAFVELNGLILKYQIRFKSKPKTLQQLSAIADLDLRVSNSKAYIASGFNGSEYYDYTIQSSDTQTCDGNRHSPCKQVTILAIRKLGKLKDTDICAGIEYFNNGDEESFKAGPVTSSDTIQYDANSDCLAIAHHN